MHMLEILKSFKSLKEYINKKLNKHQTIFHNAVITKIEPDNTAIITVEGEPLPFVNVELAQQSGQYYNRYNVGDIGILQLNNLLYNQGIFTRYSKVEVKQDKGLIYKSNIMSIKESEGKTKLSATIGKTSLDIDESNGSISINSNGFKLNINNEGAITLEASEMQFKADKCNLEANNLSIKSKCKLDGDLEVSGSITASKDIQSKADVKTSHISVNNHTHIEKTPLFAGTYPVTPAVRTSEKPI